MDERTDDEVRDACSRFLHWHGPQDAAALLAEAAEVAEVDRYGGGGSVKTLEQETAALLGKPAAVFMPSGTMAQQIALRIHAERRGRRAFAFHPTSHLDLHEGGAYQRLHDLVGRPVGDARTMPTLADLEEVAEPLAAVQFELPLRELGGRLPEWDDLVAQVDHTRERGAAAHLDGARLWEAADGMGRELPEVAGLFDTVYVSFYKTLGGITGCCLAGPEDDIAEAREWRTRHGGTLFGLWAYAASALAALRRRLPLVPRYREQMAAIAAALDGLDGVEVVPDPPQVNMVHLLLRTTPDAFRESARRVADTEGVWTWARSWPTDSPSWQRVELVTGDATLKFTPEEARDLIAGLI